MARHNPLNASDQQPASAAPSLIAERHFAPEELGTAWGLSADTIRRLFEREPQGY